MDDDLAHELVEHSYAVLIWLLTYIERKKLPLTEEPDFGAFEFHVKRLGSILDRWHYPLSKNPIVSRLNSRKDDPNLEQNHPPVSVKL